MLCLNAFELYPRWVPLIEQTSPVVLTALTTKGSRLYHKERLQSTS